jgi:hypothetical protein
MSIAQEFADHAERRRRRVARQQFWFTARREFDRRRDLLLCILALLAAGALGALIACVAMKP